MNKRFGFFGLLLLGLLLVGCGGGGDDDDEARTDLRVLHASPDAPNVDVLQGSRLLVEDLSYKTGSGFATLDAGRTYTLRVQGIVPGGVVTIIGPLEQRFGEQTENTLIAINKAAFIEPLLITNPKQAVTSGNSRLQVVHVAPGAPLVDVYVTAPGADLLEPLGTFAYTGTLGPLEVAAGTYQIRMTPAGEPLTVLYDSGSITLPDGSDLLVAAVDNTGPGSAPISLVALDGDGSFEILDVNTPTHLRAVHASPDAPFVDVVLNNNFPEPLIENLGFPNFTPYIGLPPAEYNVKVTAADNPDAVVIDFNAMLEQGIEQTVLATGFLASIEELVLVDDNRSVAPFAKVRIVHGSPSAGEVDIYVTSPGADITALQPDFNDVPFRADTDYVPLNGGQYDVTVTPAGSKQPALGPVTIEVDNGGVYTAIARDASGGGTPLGLILLDDFVE